MVIYPFSDASKAALLKHTPPLCIRSTQSLTPYKGWGPTPTLCGEPYRSLLITVECARALPTRDLTRKLRTNGLFSLAGGVTVCREALGRANKVHAHPPRCTRREFPTTHHHEATILHTVVGPLATDWYVGFSNDVVELHC